MSTATADPPTTSNDTATEVAINEPEADAGGEALFDKSRYDDPGLQIAKVDGEGIDKIGVKFSGRVLLDRSDPADVALFNSLRLGREVELRVAGKVSRTGAGWTTKREGDLDAVVGDKTVDVSTVWVLEPEDLVDQEAA